MNPNKTAKALLDIALETFTAEIQPALPKDRRYAGAMVANALGIATRRLSSPDPGAALLEATGADSLETLAASIRSGEIGDTANDRLADNLLSYVEAELAITNPKFLARRIR